MKVTGPRNKTWFDRIVTLYNKSNELERMTGAKIEINIVQGPSKHRNKNLTPLPPCITCNLSFAENTGLRKNFHQNFTDGGFRSGYVHSDDDSDDESESSQAGAKVQKHGLRKLAHDPGLNVTYVPGILNYSSIGITSHGLQDENGMTSSAYGTLPSETNEVTEKDYRPKSTKKPTTQPTTKSFFDDDLILDEPSDGETLPQDTSYFQDQNMISRSRVDKKTATYTGDEYRMVLGIPVIEEETRVKKSSKKKMSESPKRSSKSKDENQKERDSEKYCTTTKKSGKGKDNEKSKNSGRNERKIDTTPAFEFRNPKSDLLIRGPSREKSNKGRKKYDSDESDGSETPPRKQKSTETGKHSKLTDSITPKIFTAEMQAIRDSNRAAFLLLTRKPSDTSVAKKSTVVTTPSTVVTMPSTVVTTPSTVVTTPSTVVTTPSTVVTMRKTPIKLSIEIPE